ncbi:MAG TPA: PilT/PilU family type 4a pilus ATPase [Kofleriaceae bacterium]|nr:PilT/PilU family type 4a pilus ATPase [Kofleriaceae bacterium]
MIQESDWEPAMKSLLDHMQRVEASDLYITANSPPVFRIDGVGYPAKHKLDNDQIDAMAESIMTRAQRDEFSRNLEMNLALANGSGGRFRANIFRQRGATGMVIRLVRTQIKSLAELGHPPILSKVMDSKRGLVLVVGGTGSGKSTTLAAMIDHRNRTQSGHIITVEDPVEFIHQHQKCIITQREVGLDTLSYKDALKNALRQAPDVILIGEIRDAETMEMAIAFAETGHLCISTLHANNANQAIERVLNFFPPARQHEIRLQLSLNLRAIISQRLVPSLIGSGRAAALEVLLDTPRIRDLIKRGETDTIKEAMEQGANEGCCTFDSALFDLFMIGKIDESEALKAADSPNNLRIQIDRYRQSCGDVALQTEVPLRLVPTVKINAARR